MKMPFVKRKKTGIYKIINTINDKFYIGSSSYCLYQRFISHRLLLKQEKHHNRHLQNAVNKYGIDNFSIEIVEYCDLDLCLAREQYYIDTLRPHYNLCQKADSTLGIKKTKEAAKKSAIWHTGRKRSEETKQRMRESRKGFKPSEEHKKNIGLSCMGNVGHSHRAFIVTSPDGTIYNEKGIRPFCKKHVLNQGGFNQMILGKVPHYKGWKVSDAELKQSNG